MDIDNGRRYKIIQGYEHERDITIREDELDRAFGLFMLGGRWIFSGGPVDGKNIQTIVEDFHATMGWHNEHKLDNDDYVELDNKGITRHMRNAISNARERVTYLINTKQENLIGKSTDLPEIKRPKIEKGRSGLRSVGEIIKNE